MEQLNIQRELLPLFQEKLNLIQDGRDNIENIEDQIFLRKCLNQKTIYPYYNWDEMDAILINKLVNLLTLNANGNYSKIVFNNLRLLQETHFPILSDKELNQYYDAKYRELKEVIDKEENPLRMINHEIELFYVKDELAMIKQKKRVTKQKSDQIINHKIAQLKELLDLLKFKNRLLSEHIKTETDQLTITNLQIEQVKLSWEIKAKERFIEHYKKRKQIY